MAAPGVVWQACRGAAPRAKLRDVAAMIVAPGVRLKEKVRLSETRDPPLLLPTPSPASRQS